MKVEHCGKLAEDVGDLRCGADDAQGNKMFDKEGGMKNSTNGETMPGYRWKNVDTGELETIRDLRANMKLAKWLLPIVATLLLGMGGLFAWLAKRALISEIRDVIAPMERKIERMDVRIETIEKRKR